MADFEKAFIKILKNEGEYSNHPLDSGGETMYGITKEVAERNGWKIENLTIADAKFAYRNFYWNALNCDKIENQRIAEIIFDAGVNCGVKNASKMVQVVLNLLNRNNLNWLDLIVDGIIGNKTINIINSLSMEDIEYFLIFYKCERYIYYRNIALKNPKNEQFLRGWINRIFNFR
ncbi:MAG: N-acetylmuramidase [Candidatus Omnitrophica bacterium]|nr:N-acetylmuramidase [Candidatus Omnitrophota bacterium]